MNIFATIEHLETLDRVTYYSVRLSTREDEKTEFEDFLERHEGGEHDEELAVITSWLEKLGDEIGAQYDPGNPNRKQYFRHEGTIGDTKALPPEFIGGKLRLYCHVLNEHVVFLFNGGSKTRNPAQDCPIVGPHFRRANTITKVINDAFKVGDISWNDDFTDIEFDENLELPL